MSLTGELTVPTTGTSVGCPSRCSAYSNAALSKNVSCSSARWCLRQSKCYIMLECFRNDLLHPSPGHVKSASFAVAGSSSVSVWSLVAWVSLGCDVVVRPFSTEEKELGCARSILPLTAEYLVVGSQPLEQISVSQVPRRMLSIHGFPLW